MLVSISSVIRFALLTLGLVFAQSLFAQQPINITVSVLPPYPNYVDEVIEMSDQTIITIQNTDISNGYSIKLRAELSGSNGVTVRSKEGALPNSPIELAAGETMVMTGEELSIFYNNYSENDFNFIGISRQDILNNQQLPDGSYTICLRALEFHSGMQLSSASPSGCSPPFIVIAVDPPILTYPQNNTTLNTIDPQLLNINWIPVSVSLPDLRYRLEMVDLTDLPINPYDAFETGAFLFFDEGDIMANVFIYGMEHPTLLPGHKYAMRVQAYREDGPLNILNDGYSNLVVFTYGQIDEGEDEVEVDVPEPSNQDFECGQDCEYVMASGQTADASKPQIGAMLDIGNFRMRVNAIQGDGPYSGEGIIQSTEYFPVGIKVNFKDIQVNAEGRVFEGNAKSVVREESWIDESWSDIETAVDGIQFKPNSMDEAVSTLTDPAYYIDNLTGISEQVGTTLPFTIGSETNGLQVVGMNFFPERASYNLSSIIELLDDADGNPRYLHFMAKDLCITPGGIALSADEARLELVKPIRYNFDNSTQLEFQPVSSNAGKGSYLTFDCEGFQGVFAQGEVVFSPDVIKPVDSQGDVITGDTVVASFKTSFTSWSNWVATVKFDTQGEQGGNDKNLFVYGELEDYIIGVDEAYIDHSTEDNPEGMVFPENYQMNSGPDWQGVYLKTVQVILPEWIKSFDDGDERVHLIGEDLIIDGQGLTGVITADNVLTQKEGSMGKWPITVDEVRLKILQNSLAEAYFSGDLKIPVFEEPFEYQADLQFLDGRTKHTFTFSPVEEYTIPMWFANTTLENNSSLSVHINDGSAYVEADLNGAISFQPAVGDIDKMNLANITFEHFIIRSQAEPKYIEIGNIGTGVSGEELAVAGFGILLESMEWNEESADLSSLDLGLEMNLAGDLFGISGSTGLSIKNSISDLVDSLSFNFEGIDIDDVQLSAETGVVNIEGAISFFKNDEKFGTGFAGNLTVHFIETIKLEGSVLFGNVRQGSNNFDYWYAHAMAYLPTTPVPLATPIDLYGFGGGVYYNMTLENSNLPKPSEASGTINPREVFKVKKGTLGLKASVVLGLTPSSRTFNAEVTFTAEIDMNTGGLNLLAFNGQGYLMQDIEEADKSNAMLKAEVAISYDFPAKTFEANFGVQGKIPFSSPLLTVGGKIDIYRSPTLWYLKAGVPSDMMGATLDLGVAGITANGYFMTGQQLPPIELPPGVNFEFDSNMLNNTSNGLGIGFMAGLHMGMDIELTLAGTGIIIRAGAGADIALLNYSSATCNGSENFGVNKWYAQGQAYIYGSVALDIFWFNVASVEMNLIVEAAFPNPTGVHGLIEVKGKFLAWDRHFSETFSMGTFCDIQPMANAASMVDPLEAELDNLPLLGAITPANGLPDVKTTARPTIEWHQKDRSLKRFTYGDGMGGIIDKLYRIRNEYTWEIQSKNDDKWHKVMNTATTDQETQITTLQASNADHVPSFLSGGSTYRIKADVYIEQSLSGYLDHVSGYDGSNWSQALYTEGDNQGKPIVETKTHVFQTGTNLTEIEEMHVDYTLPYPRQRFYPYEYLSTGKIKFNISHEAKFQEFNTCGFEIYAEFAPVDGSAPPPRQKVDRPGPLVAAFEMSVLEPEKIYKLEIVAERSVTKTELAQFSNPVCKLPTLDEDGSMESALSEYIAGKGIEVDLVNFTAISGLPFGGPMPVASGSSSGGSAASGQGMVLAGQNMTSIGMTMPPTFNLGPANKNIGDLFSVENDIVTHRKVLYTIYFRTSKFSTPEAKMETIKVSEFTLEPQYLTLLHLQPQTIVKDVSIKIDCEEGFDKYDLFGHDYPTQETKEYFRFSGPSCASISHSGLAGDIEEWFQRVCGVILNADRFIGHETAADSYNENLQELQENTPGLDLEFKSDPSNYSGVKLVYPLLSDTEVGLGSSDVSSSYSALPLFGSATIAGSGYVVVNPRWYTGASSVSLAPTTHTVDGSGGDPELEIIYELDRRAAGRYNYSMTNNPDITGYYNSDDFPYVHPPAGNYPLTIRLMNVPESQKNSPNFKSEKFNLPIEF